MGKLAKWLFLSFVAMFTSAALAHEPYPRARVLFSQPELDQMLAPIALYPDQLLSQVLMAATYPRDLAEAASWSRANGRPQGEEAVRAAEREPWDPSVISLVAFPDLLERMDERRDWTQRLGDAFIAQPDDVMDSVQHLRRRADAAGHLRSGEEMVVHREGGYYVIEPPTPEVVYVPYYDPFVVYGDWWWPRYEPVFWRPWAGYRWYPGHGFGWGYGIRLGSGFFFSSFDWRHRHVRYSHHRPWYHHGHGWRGGDRWTHRDGNWRDGRRDGDGRWRDRDGRTGEGRHAPQRGDVNAGRAGSVAAPAAPVSNGQGLFAPQAPAPRAVQASPTTRAASPRYGVEAPRYERRREAAAPESAATRVAPESGARPVQRQWAGPQAAAPAPRAVEQRTAPVRVAPVERAAPVERSAPVRVAPAERSAPAERPAPAPRSAPAREAPERSSESSTSRGSARTRDR